MGMAGCCVYVCGGRNEQTFTFKNETIVLLYRNVNCSNIWNFCFILRKKEIMYGFFKPNFPNKIVQHKVHLSLHIYFVQRFLKTNSSSEMPIPLFYKSTPQLSATHSASNGCTRWLKLFSNLMHFTLSCNLNKIYNCTLFFEIYSQQPKQQIMAGPQCFMGEESEVIFLGPSTNDYFYFFFFWRR